jgi:hypothetical protein
VSGWSYTSIDLDESKSRDRVFLAGRIGIEIQKGTIVGFPCTYRFSEDHEGLVFECAGKEVEIRIGAESVSKMSDLICDVLRAQEPDVIERLFVDRDFMQRIG